MCMDRKQQPASAVEPGMAARSGEIRVASRSERHETRNARGVIA